MGWLPITVSEKAKWRAALIDEASGETLSPLVKRTGWNVLGSIASRLGALAAAIVMARLLGKVNYGKLAIVQASSATMGGIAHFGLGVTSTRCLSQYKTSNPEKAGRILILSSRVAAVSSVALALVFVASAKTIARVLLGAPELHPLLLLASPHIVFLGINAQQIGALAGLEAFAGLAIAFCLGAGATIALAALLPWFFGLPGAVVAVAGGSLVLCVLVHRVLREECRRGRISLRQSNIWSERNALFLFALPAAASGWLLPVSAWIAQSILIRQPNGFASFAVFTAANILRMGVLFVPSVVSAVVSPRLVDLKWNHGETQYKRLFLCNLLATVALAICVAVAISLVRGPLLALFGRDFKDPGMLVPTLLASGVCEVTSVSLYQNLIVRKSLWAQTGVFSVWCTCLVTSALYLAPRFGALGLAEAYLISWFLSATVYAVLAVRSLRS